MDVREKLVELLKECEREYENFVNKTSFMPNKAEFVADHLIAHGVTLQEWIPVSERLPGFGIERVLVMTNGDHIMGYPKMDTDRYLNGRWVRYGDNVTHWMPLPEPPDCGAKMDWRVNNDKRRNTERRQDVRVRRRDRGR